VEDNRLKKLMSLKKTREIGPVEQSAKHHVLSSLMGEMQGLMGDKLAGLKKVTVAADSKPGLAVGLEKAKDLVSGGDDHESEEPEHEGTLEGEPEEATEHLAGHEEPAEDDDDIDSQIQALMLKKEMRKKGHLA
jgi:hypothetical protein